MPILHLDTLGTLRLRQGWARAERPRTLADRRATRTLVPCAHGEIEGAPPAPIGGWAAVHPSPALLSLSRGGDLGRRSGRGVVRSSRRGGGGSPIIGRSALKRKGSGARTEEADAERYHARRIHPGMEGAGPASTSAGVFAGSGATPVARSKGGIRLRFGALGARRVRGSAPRVNPSGVRIVEGGLEDTWARADQRGVAHSLWSCDQIS